MDDYFGSAIKNDGTLYMWGLGAYGELGQEEEKRKKSEQEKGKNATESYSPVKVLDNIEAVSFGSHHVVALTKDGNIYTWGDKRQYIGDWKNNKMDGHGVFTWPDGRRYQGDYKDDKKDGYGIFEWADGKKYKGFWTNGKQNGEGEYFDPRDNVWRRGNWFNGKKVDWL